jgi:dihydrofolate reductase
MARLCVRAYGVSLDGFAAGPDQSLQQPLGVRGPELMAWAFPTRTFHAMHDPGGGEADTVDDRMMRAGFDGIGAWIIGRNMFGPVRGAWPDDSWKGWWGDEPPYRVPVFVLTHHARPPLEMAGGTVFHFVTDGIEAALRRAFDAAAGRDVRLGGGAATVRQYLQAGLVDELHLALSPVLLGRGEALWHDLDLAALGYSCTASTPGERATHLFVQRKR